MSREEFEKLGPGDIVRSENGDSYVVTDRMGETVIAVRIALIENHAEWELAEKKTGLRKNRCVVCIAKQTKKLDSIELFHLG